MTVDCAGGVVIHKFGGSAPRVLVCDPNSSTEWGGIQVKDWSTGAARDNGVSSGDWVSFGDIPVEDYRGTTFLQYDPLISATVSFSVDSTGNPLPAPVTLTAADVAAPVEGTPDFWLIADHAAEKYESLQITIENATVTALDLGKAADNYNLQTSAGDVWASDYMNPDAVGLYDPKVTLGQSFVSVMGILEQYTKIRDTYGWDYYQVLPTSTDSLVVPEPGTLTLLVCAAGCLLRRRRR
jgi:hypothetical protein